MTFKEKWIQDHPDSMFDPYSLPCPRVYGYEAMKKGEHCSSPGLTCTMCWDREMPDNNPVEEYNIDDHPEYEDVNALYKIPDDDTKEKAEWQDRNQVIGAYKIPDDVMEKKAEWRAATQVVRAEEIPDDVMEKVVEDLKNPVILDSGDRTQFETGAVRDMRTGKGRCDLMPLEVASDLLATESRDHDPILHDIAAFKQTDDTSWLMAALCNFANAAYDSLRTTMLLEVAKHFEEGARKYGESNWKRGIPVWCYIDSAIRHYLKWLRGDKDEPHDRAFVWNLMCCIWEVDYHEKDGETAS